LNAADADRVRRVLMSRAPDAIEKTREMVRTAEAGPVGFGAAPGAYGFLVTEGANGFL
jgi:hypothetical protein